MQVLSKPKRKLPALADSTSSLEDFALDNYHQDPDGFLDDVRLEKLENLKKAVTARIYHVSADEVAGKLIVHMLKLGMCRSPINAGIPPRMAVIPTAPLTLRFWSGRLYANKPN